MNEESTPLPENRAREGGAGQPDVGHSPQDRRGRPDRRQQNIPVAYDRRSGKDRRVEAANQRAAVEKRRMVDPTTCEKEYSEEEIEFLTAMDSYKRANRRPFPTWSEVLEVIRALGYRKVETPKPIPGVPLPVSRPTGE